MLWRGAAALSLAAATLLEGAYGVLVTITEYPSTCSAVYTSGSRTVTVVHSTVTVQPQPWSDAAANSGTPFVIEVSAPGASKKRQAATTAWLMANGNTTTDGSKAARWTINDSQLSANGLFVSTSSGIPYEPFAVANTLEAISRTFAVQGGIFYWNNSAFDGNTAQFYKTPGGDLDNVQVVARFSGPIDLSWEALTLRAEPGMHVHLRT